MKPETALSNTGDKHPEGTQCARGTHPEDIEKIHSQPQCRETRIIFWEGLETKYHQRQMINPVGTSQPQLERRFQGLMKLLNHTITLRMKTGCLDLGDSEDRTNLSPGQGCEL